MSKPFHERRRQQFLTEAFFNEAIRYCDEGLARFNKRILSDEADVEDRSLLAASIADFHYQRFSLRYTAGTPPEDLRNELMGVMEAYERYQKALAEYEGIPQIAPLGFRELDDYERCMQLIGLCYLLHRRDLLPRIVALQDPAYEGEDTLFEDLMAFELEGRYDVDEWYHDKPYATLVHAMYEQDKAEAAKKLKAYCDEWYPAFKYVPWHDGHLRIDGTEGDYFGYWAFEAGAVALLCDIDDSAITHMVYPKDLVAWSRANKALSEAEPSDSTRLRCAANHPCPKEGWWFTPAKADSRRYFKQGEIMPDLGSAWGSTIWQWDDQQTP